MLQLRTLVIGDSHIRRISDIWVDKLQHTTVHWRYKGGADISWLRNNLDGCEDFDIVIICIGGNDLDNGTKPDAVASQLMDIATLCAKRGVKKTIVTSIWPRDKPYFLDNVMLANTDLDEGLNNDDKRTVFWKQERRMRFEFYDGIHLRHYKGARRYLVSCIMWAEMQLRRANSP